MKKNATPVSDSDPISGVGAAPAGDELAAETASPLSEVPAEQAAPAATEVPARDPSVPDEEGRCTAEVWAAKNKTPDWLFAATKACHGWPIGKELTEPEYAAAVTAAAGTTCR